MAMKKSGNIDIFQVYCCFEDIVDRLKDYFCSLCFDILNFKDYLS